MLPSADDLDMTQAEAEGWIFCDGGIQRDDEADTFDSDSDAVAYVAARACEGSAYHAKALTLHTAAMSAALDEIVDAAGCVQDDVPDLDHDDPDLPTNIRRPAGLSWRLSDRPTPAGGTPPMQPDMLTALAGLKADAAALAAKAKALGLDPAVVDAAAAGVMHDLTAAAVKTAAPDHWRVTVSRWAIVREAVPFEVIADTAEAATENGWNNAILDAEESLPPYFNGEVAKDWHRDSDGIVIARVDSVEPIWSPAKEQPRQEPQEPRQEPTPAEPDDDSGDTTAEARAARRAARLARKADTDADA